MPEERQNIIDIENLKLLTTKFKKPILEIEKLSFKKNVITVIIGPNGAGKSLFLHLLQGLINPTKGKIKFNQKIPYPNSTEISIVMQKPRFLRRNVEKNIKFVLKLNNKNSPKYLTNVLQRFNLLKQRELLANNLSGGEKQRLALALAICKNPSILLLDEPTASADPQTTFMIEKILAEELSFGRKLILVTHDIAQAKRLGHDIIFIHKGRVVEHNKVKTFFNQPAKKETMKFLSGEITI